MKILKSNSISPFGGLNFVLEYLQTLKIDKFLNHELPSLPRQSNYEWKDILYSFWSVFLCGGDCVEDLGANFKNYIKDQPFIKVPSPDRVLERIKELSEDPEYFRPKRSSKDHHFSINNQLTKLNLCLLQRLGVFDNKQELTLDYDNTVCPTRKKDATNSYLKTKAYQPGVAFIGANVVYVENRNGNSGAQILQQDTLKRCFQHLSNHKIKVTRFRADSASFQLSTLKQVEQNCKYYYIKARMNERIAEAISQVESWSEIMIGGVLHYRGEIDFKPFNEVSRKLKIEDISKSRLVITKTAKSNKQINLFTNEAMVYSIIVTNDWKMSKDEIVLFYNQRGKTEREFDVLKNDFGWKKLPFSYLHQNTPYLILTAICKNLYNHLIQHFSKKIKGIKPTDRIKKFIFRFISIPAKWIKRSRGKQLRIYGEIAFKT